MTDYSKQTVSQLKNLLTQRGLATAGKKDELIIRLQENEKIKGIDSLAPPDEEIDWDDHDDKKSIEANSSPEKGSELFDKEGKLAAGNVLHASGAPKSTFTYTRILDTFSLPHTTHEASDKGNTKLREADEEAKRKRAERFGVSVKEKDNVKKLNTNVEKDTLSTQYNKKRQNPVLDDPIEAEKARRRAERFTSNPS